MWNEFYEIRKVLGSENSRRTFDGWWENLKHSKTKICWLHDAELWWLSFDLVYVVNHRISLSIQCFHVNSIPCQSVVNKFSSFSIHFSTVTCSNVNQNFFHSFYSSLTCKWQIMKFIVENESEQEQEACWDELNDTQMLWLVLEIFIYNLDSFSWETRSIPCIHLIKIHLSVGFSRFSSMCQRLRWKLFSLNFTHAVKGSFRFMINSWKSELVNLSNSKEMMTKMLISIWEKQKWKTRIEKPLMEKPVWNWDSHRIFVLKLNWIEIVFIWKYNLCFMFCSSRLFVRRL
jgi:hypothetical protein